MVGITVEKTSALRQYLVNYKLFPEETSFDPISFLDACQPHVRQFVQDAIGVHGAVILWQCLNVTMDKLDGAECVGNFTHRRQYILVSTDIDEVLAQVAGVMMDNCLTFQEKGSGWTIKDIINLDVHLCPYTPITAGTYKPLPPQITTKKAVINIKNTDEL